MRMSALESVFDEVPAGALDDAGCDRPALFQGGRVVQQRLLVGQVGGAPVCVLACAPVQAGEGGGSAQGAGDPGRVSLEDLLGVLADPGFGGVAFAVEGPGGLPEVFQDVHEVDLSRHRDRSTYAEQATMPTVASAVLPIALFDGGGVMSSDEATIWKVRCF